MVYYFRFQAVQYKRQYGQPIVSNMAVVIQEMVSPDSAGVMFTCDPVSDAFFEHLWFRGLPVEKKLSGVESRRDDEPELASQVTANPLYTAVTANFGLGESVVSASAEPDTFILRKNRDSGYDLEETKVGAMDPHRKLL